MPDAFLLTVCGLFGLLVGSFLNVVIWRVPRHESIVRPGSHCPSCGTELGAIENVPVLSWLALRGRCRHCGTRISVRYPLVELLTAGLWVGLALRFGAAWELPPYLVLAAGLVALSLIDLDHFLLPNRVLYPTGFMMAALFVIPAVVDGQGDDYLRGVLGGAVAFTVFFVIHVISPRGMGFGDVRLSFVLGLRARLAVVGSRLPGPVPRLPARCGRRDAPHRAAAADAARTTSRSVPSSPRVRCSPSTSARRCSTPSRATDRPCSSARTGRGASASGRSRAARLRCAPARVAWVVRDSPLRRRRVRATYASRRFLVGRSVH